MAAGTPVITTECAGVAGELVLHQENGFVLPVDVEQWARTVVRLLKDEFEWLRFSENATKAVAAYTFDIAAQGIVSACALAVPQLEGVEHRNHE
jgi:glycosyltransferase involved in cell wall biosynthesis